MKGSFEDSLSRDSIEHFAFCEEASKAYAIVATSEGAIYANLMLQKGVIQ